MHYAFLILIKTNFYLFNTFNQLAIRPPVERMQFVRTGKIKVQDGNYENKKPKIIADKINSEQNRSMVYLVNLFINPD